jgi:hypothetical protein
MNTLAELKEKRKAYVKAEAEKILNDMLERGKTTSTLATCNAPNWDIELHNAMPEICRELREMGVNSSSSVNWGVTDWVFTIITD